MPHASRCLPPSHLVQHCRQATQHSTYGRVRVKVNRESGPTRGMPVLSAARQRRRKSGSARSQKERGQRCT
eukprot:352331-Chlamydomonas_euryale.AAC.3